MMYFEVEIRCTEIALIIFERTLINTQFQYKFDWKVTDSELLCHGGEFHNSKTCVCHHLDLATTDAVITSRRVHHDS